MPQRPKNDDRDSWRDYWVQMGQPWRTEPEIDARRQHFLAERRAIAPDIEKDIYPFKDVKLTHADVEWLLATHENGRGPVDWGDKKQRGRKGLDLRGADLRRVNLDDLPLACICGGLTGEWWNAIPDDRLEVAAVHFEGAILRKCWPIGVMGWCEPDHVASRWYVPPEHCKWTARSKGCCNACANGATPPKTQKGRSGATWM